MENLKTIKENYTRNVSSEIVDTLLEETGCVDVEIFEGVLQDRYIFWNTTNINFGGLEPRGYIVIKEVYKNCWASSLQAIFTDDINFVEDYHQVWTEDEEVINYYNK